jgi:hypothetical protein
MVDQPGANWPTFLQGLLQRIQTAELVLSLRNYIRLALGLGPIPEIVPVPSKARRDRKGAEAAAERTKVAMKREAAVALEEWGWVLAARGVRAIIWGVESLGAQCRAHW